MKNSLILTLILIVFFISACAKVETGIKETSIEEQAISACVELCKNTKQDLTNGPCLSDEIKPDWVCDIAHSPRQDIDNVPENQCSAFREGRAKHFVELDLNCNVIKVF